MEKYVQSKKRIGIKLAIVAGAATFLLVSDGDNEPGPSPQVVGSENDSFDTHFNEYIESGRSLNEVIGYGSGVLAACDPFIGGEIAMSYASEQEGYDESEYLLGFDEGFTAVRDGTISCRTAEDYFGRDFVF